MDWCYVFKLLIEKHFQPIILYPSKFSETKERESPRLAKAKEFITTKLALKGDFVKLKTKGNS